MAGATFVLVNRSRIPFHAPEPEILYIDSRMTDLQANAAKEVLGKTFGPIKALRADITFDIHGTNQVVRIPKIASFTDNIKGKSSGGS